MGVHEQDVPRRRRHAAIALAALGAPLAAASPAAADDPESTPPPAPAEADTEATTSASTQSQSTAEAGGDEHAAAQGSAGAEIDVGAKTSTGAAENTHGDEDDASTEKSTPSDDDSKGAWNGSAPEKSHGDAAVTGVEVRRGDHGSGRAAAHVKAGAGLEAAIRADARAVAKDEVRKEHARAGIRARGREAAAMLEVFRAAWQTGGSTRANALLELCFGGDRDKSVSKEALTLLASLEQRAALQERFRGRGYAFAYVKVRGEGSERVKVTGDAEGVKPETEGDVEGVKPETKGDAKGQVPATVQAPSATTLVTAPSERAAPQGQENAPQGQENASQGQVGPASQGNAPQGQVAPASQENSPQGTAQFAAFAPDTSTDTDTSSGQTAQTAASNGQLASTGRDLLLLAALGSSALAGGLLLRRRLGGTR